MQTVPDINRYVGANGRKSVAYISFRLANAIDRIPHYSYLCMEVTGMIVCIIFAPCSRRRHKYYDYEKTRNHRNRIDTVFR